eukprot:10329661-Alexandrium_andersonii.AAC.1
MGDQRVSARAARGHTGPAALLVLRGSVQPLDMSAQGRKKRACVRVRVCVCVRAHMILDRRPMRFARRAAQACASAR